LSYFGLIDARLCFEQNLRLPASRHRLEVFHSFFDGRIRAEYLRTMQRGKALGDGSPGGVARAHFSCWKARRRTGSLKTLRITLTDASELPTTGNKHAC